MNSPQSSLDNNKIKKTLRFSLIDGIFASGMLGFTQDYFTPFLLLQGGSSRQVGLLNALPNLFASLVQAKSADLTARLKSRKKMFSIFAFLHALMLLPLSAMAFLHVTNAYLFILIIILFASFMAISGPPWASLMSDLVHESKRGEYFGWRNRIFGFTIVSMTFIAGVILYFMKKINAFYGFGIIFLCAFLFRLISWYYLTRMHEPHLEHKKEDSFTIFDFISRIRESNFAKFVLFVSLMNFSVNLVSPFFSVLMLRDLSFNYLTYTFVTITATFTLYATMSRWGRHADKVGNVKIIRLTSRLVSILPLLWVINQHPAYLFVIQVMAGFAWSGFNFCASNFIYDAVTPEKRTRCIAYFNVFNGLALCFGAMLGGFIVGKLPNIFGYKILTLALISSILRILVSLIMSDKIKEVRVVDGIRNNRLFFSMIGVKPILGGEQKTSPY